MYNALLSAHLIGVHTDVYLDNTICLCVMCTHLAVQFLVEFVSSHREILCPSMGAIVWDISQALGFSQLKESTSCFRLQNKCNSDGDSYLVDYSTSYCTLALISSRQIAVQSCFSGYILFVMGGLSITAGAHRLWSHRSYKAKLPLRIMLMLFNLVAGQVMMSTQLISMTDNIITVLLYRLPVPLLSL